MTVLEFTRAIEKIFTDEVVKLYPGYWLEDQLTINFLISVKENLSNSYLSDLRNGSFIKMNLFKQRGKNSETKYGDVAVISNILYPDGTRVEGIGYLEAKKRAVGQISFEAVKESQLKTISSNAPRAKLLLYDYEPITSFIQDYSYFLSDDNKKPTTALLSIPITYATALPINLALEIGNYDTNLYKFGLPLSHQIAFRYMHGQDLEFDKSSINTSKGFADKVGLPKYILSITSISATQIENSLVNSNRPIVNPNPEFYREL